MSSSSSSSSSSSGIGFCGVLTVLFVALKLLGKISWSWWWIASPLWIPIVVILAIIATAFCVLQILNVVDKRKK